MNKKNTDEMKNRKERKGSWGHRTHTSETKRRVCGINHYYYF